jgi:hypothetical protein
MKAPTRLFFLSAPPSYAVRNQTARDRAEAPFIHGSMFRREQKHPIQQGKPTTPMTRNGRIARLSGDIRTELNQRSPSQYNSVQVNPTNKKNFPHRRSVKYGATHESPTLRAAPAPPKTELLTSPNWNLFVTCFLASHPSRLRPVEKKRDVNKLKCL